MDLLYNLLQTRCRLLICCDFVVQLVILACFTTDPPQIDISRVWILAAFVRDYRAACIIWSVYCVRLVVNEALHATIR